MCSVAFGQVFNEKVDPTIWLVTSAHGTERGGLIATFVSNASLVPDEPRVVIGIAKQHFTWTLIDQSRAFALHVVSQSQVEWVRHFGLRSAHEVVKFNGLTPDAGETGCPVFTEADLWSECIVEAMLDIGDRSLFLARVARHGRGSPGQPLTLSRLVKSLSESDRAEMERRFVRDAAVDALAIEKWRSVFRDLKPTER